MVVNKVKVTNPSTSTVTEADIGGNASNISYSNTNNIKIENAENVQAAIDELAENIPDNVTIAVEESFQDGTKIATVTIGEDDIDLKIPTPLTITPNPSSNPSQNLNNITIGNTTYHIAGTGGGATSLDDLSDVTVSSPVTGQLLRCTVDGQNVSWTNSNDDSITVIANPSGSTGSSVLSGLTVGNDTYSVVSDINDLSSVTINNPQIDQVLKYNGTTWVNANESGGSGSVAHLADIGDVVITSATAGQGLRYNGTNWVNDTITVTQSLNDLSNVSLTSPTEGQVLKYDSDSGEWINADESGGGAIGSGQWVDLTGTLTAGSTILTISNSIIDVDSTFDIYTSVFGVNPTNVIAFTQGITLYFDAQPNDIGVKVRVTSDYMPGGNGNVSGSIPTSVTVTEVTE